MYTKYVFICLQWKPVNTYTNFMDEQKCCSLYYYWVIPIIEWSQDKCHRQNCTCMRFINSTWGRFKTIWIMCTNGSLGWVLTYSLDWFLSRTSRLIWDGHPEQCSGDTRPSLDYQSVDSQLIVDQLIWSDRKLVYFRPTVTWRIRDTLLLC